LNGFDTLRSRLFIERNPGVSPPRVEVRFGEKDSQQTVFFYYWVVDDIIEETLEAFSGKL